MGLIREQVREILLVESRVSDLKSKYVGRGRGKVSDETFEILKEGDPSKNHKYLEWMVKQIIRGWGIDLKPKYIIDLVNEFDKKVNRLDNKDLYSYRSWAELESLLSSLGPSKSELNNIKKKDTIRVYEDDVYLVVIPKTKESSCYYGSSTKWCTSAKKDNQFYPYSADGTLVYIINKKLDPSDRFSKVALNIPGYLDHDLYNIEFYDVFDDEFNPHKNDFMDMNLFNKILPKIYNSVSDLSDSGGVSYPFNEIIETIKSDSEGELIDSPLYEYGGYRDSLLDGGGIGIVIGENGYTIKNIRLVGDNKFSFDFQEVKEKTKTIGPFDIPKEFVLGSNMFSYNLVYHISDVLINTILKFESLKEKV